MKRSSSLYIPLALILIGVLLLPGCAAKRQIRTMETTAYCGCKSCCDWERGSWKALKLDFWNRYVARGRTKGRAYSGKTACGTDPHEPRSGLFSTDSLLRPWMIPLRIVFFPWLLLPQSGTIAADQSHFSCGTKMYIPGYGKAIVEDRGGAIKGPTRLDLFFNSHAEALRWGRKKVRVELIP